MREKYKKLKSKLRIRRITLLMALLLGVILTYCTSDENKDISELQKDIAGKIIRFHVLANSDSDEDQALKLKVKENVVRYITPLLENSEDINETREILSKIRQEIINIAEETIKNEGYEYDVTAKITYCYFPTKAYGDIVLPPGEYEAFEIEIGEARGKNWWCILYPPLCFVDVTHGVVPDSSKQMLKNILDEDEYEAVTNVEDNVGYRFKVLEWLGFYD
ncbi:MAG: stage II sporulation protein R [Lachnospiraceae bacterium]|nr:stage II sporulation protein R [Lachnospiraceae bacterium]